MKILIKKISNCAECPYVVYDASYSRSSPSGYECYLTHERLANDNQDLSLLPIPDNCQLPNEREEKLKKIID